MIFGAAFCPHPPVLLPAVAGGAASELAALRAACLAAIERASGSGAQLVVLGAGERSRVHSPLARGSLAGFGVPTDVHLGSPSCGGALELPLSLTVGAWLVTAALGPRTNAVGVSVGPDFGGSAAAAELLGLASSREVALVVMGDGSACRSVKAPGYLDARAEPFDATVATALATRVAGGLAGLDAELGAELLAAGVPAWRAAGDLLDGGSYASELLYQDDPYGVAYLVAAWTSSDGA